MLERGRRCGGSSSSLRNIGVTRRHTITYNARQRSPWQRNDNNKPRNPFVRPILFSGAVCLGSFGVVAIWNAELEAAAHAQRQAKERTVWDKVKSIWRLPVASQAKISDNSNKMKQEKREFYFPAELGRVVPHQIIYAAEDAINGVINNDTVGPIILTTLLFHGLLSLPGMELVKVRYFVHDPTSGRALPMLLSTFAHNGLFHLGVNMFVLWNFGQQVVSLLNHDNRILAQKEQLWAAYVSAGTLSSLGSIFTSYLMKNVRGIPMHPGLGASGAVCAIISSAFLFHPDMMVSIVPLPYIPAVDALKLLVAFDVAGLVYGYTGLGHGAHLAGCLTGFWVVEMDGLRMIWLYQAWVDRTYRALKKTFLAS